MGSLQEKGHDGVRRPVLQQVFVGGLVNAVCEDCQELESGPMGSTKMVPIRYEEDISAGAPAMPLAQQQHVRK